ncbi:MAG: 6-phosphofructokinase [Acidimicrobiia bacterium]|nr:6-phosphofructokinase [Acidimicrobiia bacterium]
MTSTIGILTAGGDSPGLNAAIRAIGKSAIHGYGMNVIGFKDGFRGLMQNRVVRLDGPELSGILTKGGTILGTSRDKPHKMDVGGSTMDMTDLMLENFNEHQLDALVCLGGGGTQKNALRLAEKGMRVLTLPKTIDNDVWGTDATFGFDTALGIATEAVDRLHSTAHSHHRIMVVEVMGHNTGWLALGAGVAGGADAILMPEIPYDIGAIAETILERKAAGSTFSIVAVSEGARSADDRARLSEARAARDAATTDEELSAAEAVLSALDEEEGDHTRRLSRQLESLTGLASRVTILGHVQRGGTPSAIDRLLATRLGAACTEAIHEGIAGVLVASRDEATVMVPLAEVAGKRKTVPLDHRWIKAGRSLGVCFGD